MKSNKTFFNGLLFLVCVFLIITIYPHALVSLGYSLLLVIVLSKMFNSNISDSINVFLIYTILCLVLFLFQLNYLPNWFGLSGPYRGIGTDDSRYFAGIADSLKFIPHGARDYIGWDHWFSALLNLLYPFPIDHPLELVIFNLLGVIFLPFLACRVASEINPSITKINLKLIFLFILFCPFIGSNVLIIMREGWVASFILIGLLSFLKKHYFYLIIAFSALLYLRPASIIILTALLVPIYLRSTSNKKKIVIFSILPLIFVLILNLFNDFFLNLGITGLIRTEFIESLLFDLDPNSTIYKIFNLGFPFNIILLPTFFFFVPFPDFSIISSEIIPRHFLEKIISPIYNIFPMSALIYFIQKKSKNIYGRSILYGYIYSIIIISLMSLQVRHKVMVMPLFYILAFTFFKPNKNFDIILFLFSLLTLILIFL
jgi:hypothetical protein